MRDALEIILPATFGLLFFGVIFGFLGWLRWMRFREMIALAERGYRPADAPNGTNRMLRWSLVLIALGLAFSCGIAPIAFDHISSFPALIPGFSMLFLGLALLLYWLITGGRAHLAERMSLASATPLPAPPPTPPAPTPLTPTQPAPTQPAAWSPDAPADHTASADAVDDVSDAPNDGVD